MLQIPDNLKNANMPIHQFFIQSLLRPKSYKNLSPKSIFPFNPQTIITLAEQCMQIVSQQPPLLKLAGPMKIFGDLHGQYSDLMRFFD